MSVGGRGGHKVQKLVGRLHGIEIGWGGLGDMAALACQAALATSHLPHHWHPKTSVSHLNEYDRTFTYLVMTMDA